MIGDNLRRIRAEKELTQRKLAKIAMVSEPQISRYEKGLAKPNLMVLRKLSRALNVTIEELEYDPKAVVGTIKTDKLLELIKNLGPLNEKEYEIIEFTLEAVQLKKVLQKVEFAKNISS